MLGVNLEGVVNGLQAFLPRMKAQAGEKHVVNTASVAGIAALPGLGVYTATKYAVVGISETLRAEGERVGARRLRAVSGRGAHAHLRERAQPPRGARRVEAARARPASAPDAHRCTGSIRSRSAAACARRCRADELYIFTHPGTRALFERRAARDARRLRRRGRLARRVID